MIQTNTLLKIADNSGAKRVKTIGFPGFSKKHSAGVAQVVSTVVVEALPEGLVKDDEKVRALIVRVKKETARRDGSYIRFDENAAVLVDLEGNLIGSRVFGPIAREVREAGFLKVASLAPEVW